MDGHEHETVVGGQYLISGTKGGERFRKRDIRDGWLVAVTALLTCLGVEEQSLELVELGDDVAALKDVVEFFL